MRESRWTDAGLNQCRLWPISLEAGILVFCPGHGSGRVRIFHLPSFLWMDDISQLPREWTIAKQHVTEGVRTMTTPEFPIQLVDAEEIPTTWVTRQEEAKQIPIQSIMFRPEPGTS